VDRLPSAALVIIPSGKSKGSGRALRGLEQQLRDLPIPVIGRVHDGALWLDLRCLEDEAAFATQFSAMLKG
jgi:L-seryl-tRNA(Ser) seleniumtransferase